MYYSTKNLSRSLSAKSAHGEDGDFQHVLIIVVFGSKTNKSKQTKETTIRQVFQTTMTSYPCLYGLCQGCQKWLQSQMIIP